MGSGWSVPPWNPEMLQPPGRAVSCREGRVEVCVREGTRVCMHGGWSLGSGQWQEHVGDGNSRPTHSPAGGGTGRLQATENHARGGTRGQTFNF